VLVIGEVGAGKTYVAELLAADGRGPIETLDAVLATHGEQDWIASARRKLLNRGRLVVSHLEALPVELQSTLGGLLREAQDFGGRLVATADRSIVTARSRLGDHFPVRLELPALRHRTEDIADIAPFLLGQYAGQGPAKHLRPNALQALMAMEWSGNIRELRMVLISAAVRAPGREIDLRHFPAEYRGTGTRRHLTSLKRSERESVLDALSVSRGNKKAAADSLGIARSTLYRKMRALGIDDKRWDA
jgi:DNA-binding NtrC family response regulator